MQTVAGLSNAKGWGIFLHLANRAKPEPPHNQQHPRLKTDAVLLLTSARGIG